MQVVPSQESKATSEYLSRISLKGQITVPAPIRQILGVRPKDKLAFAVSSGKVQLVRARSGVDASFQVVPALPRKLSNKQVAEAAVNEHVREVAREGM